MKPRTILTAGANLAASARAWQLPQAGLQHALGQPHPFSSVPTHDDDIDIVTGSQFLGLKTFAQLPYVNALADDEASGNEYDIAILGAPFDTSTSGRPGARYGPGGIRTGSQRMFLEEISIYTGQGTLNRWAKIVDCGDVGLTWFDNRIALRQLDKAHRVRLLSLATVQATMSTGKDRQADRCEGDIRSSCGQLQRFQDAPDLDPGR